MFPLFQKYFNPQFRTNKMLNSCLPPLSFKIRLTDTSFHISLNSVGFYLSRMLVEFPNLYIPPCVGEFFQFLVFTFLENAPVLHSKLQAGFFENLFPPRQKGDENYDLLYQNSIRKHEDDLEH